MYTVATSDSASLAVTHASRVALDDTHLAPVRRIAGGSCTGVEERLTTLVYPHHRTSEGEHQVTESFWVTSFGSIHIQAT
jgi:hypothetical protein